MHGNLDLILTLTGGLAAALALGYITHRIGLSPIVGYLLAGIVVGPNTPGFIANRELADQMAEIGVILLMFGVGLHFHVEELLAVRRIAIPGAVVQSLVATALGALTAWVIGWGWTAGLAFGLALSVASTVVLTRVLVDNNDLHTPTGHIAIGWLVVEDIFTVVVLVLLPALFGGDAEKASLTWALFMAMVKISVLIAGTLVVGGYVLPWLLTRVAATRSRELFTLSVLTIALGIAVGSAKLFGVSMALGAFLAGMVVGRSEFSLRAATEALPMRDAFAVLFFVSVGMLFNPRYLLEAPGLVAATLAIVMLGKPLAAFAIVQLLGYPRRVGLAVSAALAQIGEFSFILAALGGSKGLDILPDGAINALVAAAIVSISLNPLLYRLVDPLAAWMAKQPWLLWTERIRGKPMAVESGSHEEKRADLHHAIVVGYGPVGQTLARLLRDNEIEPTVIDMNLEVVQSLKAAGHPAVYGDAGHSEILTAAGIRQADGIVLSASGMRNSEEIIRLVRELNPTIRILARCVYLREAPALRVAGADAIFTGEGEVALAMTESILRELGAVPEQIDRERERVRSELFEGVPPAKMR